MSERDFTTQPTDERDVVAQLEAQLEAAKFDVKQKELFGKYDITTPNENEESYQSYLDKRPKNESAGDNLQYEHSQKSEVAYEDMSLQELARKYGTSEAADDKSVGIEILTVLENKMNEKALSNGWTEETKNLHYRTLLDIADKEMRGADIENKPAASIDLDTASPEVTTTAPGEVIPTTDGESTIADILQEAVAAENKFSQPAKEGESQAEYEARHQAQDEGNKIDMLDDIVLSPIAGEQDKVDDLSDIELVSLPEAEAPEGDSEPLDEEKQSIWNRAKDRSKGLFAKAGAFTSTTLFRIGNRMPTPKRKHEETNEQFEKRTRRIGAIKLVGAVAIIAAGVFAMKLGLDGPDIDNAPSIGNADGGAGPDGYVPEQAAPVIETAPAFSPEASNVEPGEGWYQTFNEMGITDSTEQANLLKKVGPELQARGLAFPMENGLWGISNQNQLSNDVLELIKNSR